MWELDTGKRNIYILDIRLNFAVYTLLSVIANQIKGSLIYSQEN